MGAEGRADFILAWRMGHFKENGKKLSETAAFGEVKLVLMETDGALRGP